MEFKDQLNRVIELNNVPRRIVSLVPSQTELLVDLGLEHCLVGITKFCVHPKHLKKDKSIVGGTKKINLEKIKTLQPDVILCNREENTKAVVKGLEAVAPIHVSNVSNLDDLFELIRMYGNLFSIQKKASVLINTIKTEREQFKITKKTEEKQNVAYFIWRNPWMVAAADTFIDAMLKEANFRNIFESKSRYPEIDMNAKELNDVDILLLSSEPYPFKEMHVKELKHKFPDKNIKLVDGEMFSWFGSRTIHAFKYFNIL